MLLPKPGQDVADRRPNRVQPQLALYRRRSFRTDTNATMTRQLQRMCERADALGGRYDLSLDLYEDDDISAKGGKFRPGVESLLAAIRAGRYDGVVIWEFSRWTRNRAENRIMTHLMRAHGCELYSYQEQWLTLHGPVGMLVEWAADLAARESERISDRIMQWHEAMSQVGAMRGGPPFGMVTVDAPSPWPDRAAPIKLLAPDEQPRKEYGWATRASLVREAFALVDSGESQRSVATSWNSRGWPSVNGAPWTAGGVARMLRNPHYAGFAVLRGAVVYDPDAKPVAPHTPLVEPEVFHRVQPVPSRPRATSKDSPLRGLFRCGSCGHTMVYAPRSDRKGWHLYRCSAAIVDACERRVSVTAERAEQHVLALVAEVLADEDRLAQLGPPPPDERQTAQAQEQLRGAEAALLRLQRHRVQGDYDDADGQRRYDQLRHELLAEVATARQLLRGGADRRRALRLDGVQPAHATVEAALESMSVERRRHLVQQLVEKVVVAPWPNRGAAWDPSRLEVVWRRD